MPIGPSCAVADVTPNGAVVLAQHAGRLPRCATGSTTILGLPLEPDPRRVLGGRGSFGNGPARFDTGVGGRGDVAARRRAGAAAVHALGRARLGQLQPRGAGRPARRASTRTGSIVALRLHRVRDPRDVDDGRADEPARRHPARCRRASAAASVANSGTQYDIPNRRVTGKSLPVFEHVLQDVRAACAAARRRRASPRSSSSTSSPTWPGWTRTSFRLQNISTAPVNDGFGQWRDALVGVARLAGWRPRVAASRLSSDDVVHRPRDRDRRLRRLAGRRRGRDRGEQEDRQDRRRSTSTRPRSPGSPSTCPGSRTRSRAT